MSELKDIHDTLKRAFDHARVEWEKDHNAGHGRKESYWQGKKDGLRTAMNLIYQLIPDDEK